MPEIFHFYFPNSFHTQFRIFHTLNALDIILSKDSSRTTNRAQIETAILLTSIRYLLATITFANIIMLPPCDWNKSTYGSIRPAVVGPIEPQAIPSGVFAGPA